MNHEFNIKPAVIVEDHFIIAALATVGHTCAFLTLRDRDALAVFEDTPELKDALSQFESNSLSIDALTCWEALDELNDRLAEEAYAHEPKMES